jgi:hypothetical protein
VFFIFVFFFKIASAEVVISEVKYSPTTKQWIEIYNNTEESINLTDYKIVDFSASVNGHSISSASQNGDLLPPHQFAIVAKVPGDFSSSYLFKSSLGIKVSYDNVKLLGQNASVENVVIDGTAVDGKSIQLLNDSWKACEPTPGSETLVNCGEINTDGDDDNNNDGSGGGSSSGGSTSSSSGSSSSSSKPKVKIIPTYKSKLLVPSLAFAGQQVEFNLEVKYGDEIFACGKYFWNFGDGDSKQYEGGFKKFTHTYYYPGEYNVSLEYFKNNGAFEPSIVDEMTIKVVPMTVSISNVGDYQDFFIEISNDADSKINISNWILSSDYKNFVLPKNTVIAKNSSVVISGKISGFTVADKSSLKLSMPTGEVVFDYNSKSVPVKRVAESSYNNFSENENTENSEYNSDSKNSNSNSKKDLASAPILSGQGSVLSKYGFVIGLFAFLLVGGALVYFVRRKNTSVTVSDQFDVIDE